MQLSHHASVDLYCDTIIAAARLVIVRLLSAGSPTGPTGSSRSSRPARRPAQRWCCCPATTSPTPSLPRIPPSGPRRISDSGISCCTAARPTPEAFLACAASLIGRRFDWLEPAELPRAGIYWPGLDHPGLNDLRRIWAQDDPVAALIFYRALVQADNVAPVLALIEALGRNGVNCLPMYCTSLKDPVSAGIIESLLTQSEAGIVLNGTGFAVSTPGKPTADSPLNATGAPVLQVVFSGGNEKDWRAGTRGLSARDIAMNVALPEVDGRILSRAVSFKGEARFDESTQCSLVAYEPAPDRIEFTAKLAASWLRLGRTPIAERRLAIILANYPNRDGRLGNGVGLDTPASVVGLLRTLEDAGYDVTDIPRDGDALIERVRRGPTNARAGWPRDFRDPRSGGISPVLRCAAGSGPPARHRPLGKARVRSVPPRRLQRVCPACVRVRQRRHRTATGTRLQHRPAVDLSRPGPGASARLLRVLRLAAHRARRPCRHPCGEARQPRMAAGQGARARRDVLPGGGLRAAAAPLPVHRQRPPARVPRPSDERRRSSSTTSRRR